MVCKVGSCERLSKGKGLCAAHYMRLFQTGSINPDRPIMKRDGRSFTPEYSAWSKMKDRCYNVNGKRYPEWGGRGIRVCDRWLNSFENFFADMGFRPTPRHSLDRKDNDGDYSPENVRWATKTEQSINRRTFSNNKSGVPGIHFNNRDQKWVVRVTVDGVRKSLGVHNTLEEAKAARTQFGSTL